MPSYSSCGAVPGRCCAKARSDERIREDVDMGRRQAGTHDRLRFSVMWRLEVDIGFPGIRMVSVENT